MARKKDLNEMDIISKELETLKKQTKLLDKDKEAIERYKNKKKTIIISLVAAVSILIIAVLPDFMSLLEATKEISSVTTVSSDVLKTMLKAFLILTVGGIVSDICRDNSENTLAGVVDTVVKILAISCAIPTFSAVLVTALALLEQ